jgi:Ca2+-binding EF-hand superfamily protein
VQVRERWWYRPTMEHQLWRDDFDTAFARFDADDNGSIDRREFEQLLDALGSDMSARDREIGFALIDADGDGSITRDELLGWWEIVREEGRADQDG